MPNTTYLNITINSQPVDVGSIEDFPIVLNYSLEDPEDFQKKESNTAFNVKVPATLRNRKIANSYHDASTEDMTPGQTFRSHQPAVIEADGNELLSGKAFLLNASHSGIPLEYEYNFYGGNGDWIVDLKEKTLYDFLSRINFLYGILNIVNSWSYDGRDETMPYLFAPVRYRGMMDEDNGKDDNVTMGYLRPAISKYWLIYWGFQSLGYRIQSAFFDTEFFRRQVMPWTWGSFLTSEGTKLDVHNFLAKSEHERFINDDYDDILELYIKDGGLPGAFDNNNEFSYTNQSLIWEYKAPFSGALDAYFACTASTSGNIVGDNSFFGFFVRWYYVPVTTGVEELFKTEVIFQKSGSNLSTGNFFDPTHSIYANHIVNPGDKVIARFYLRLHEGKGIGARVNFHTSIDEFKLDYFRTPINGTINFENYTGFKKYKFLDYFAGIVDEFNLSVQTDAINKVVYIEPTHHYNVDGTIKQGFFTDQTLNWQDKLDFSKIWNKTLFSDYEKEVAFRYKDDTNDGALKIVQDRNQNVLAAGKYVFPDRFKAGKREHENRFFAPTMHCELEQFKDVTGTAPQMVVIVPENISNTSNSEADNTFTPKSCYYKGLVQGVGGWRFQGVDQTYYPYMFAVNYKAGGELDPVLSYSDENINGVIAKGLLKKFFWQRLAIMRNGEFYQSCYMKLNNTDVNRLHREYKVFEGQKWELVQIVNYLPLKDETTACNVRKWVPVAEVDSLNSFPSSESVLSGNVQAGNDVKYAALKCLITDIPK